MRRFPARLKANNKANIMVMTMATVVVFSTIAISISELVENQALEVQMILARSKVDYAAMSGVVHMNNLITEDVGTQVSNPMKFTYKKKYCAAWVSREGFQVCDEGADPRSPCCLWNGPTCERSNVKGVCEDQNYWEATYFARYDSLTKSIVSSGSLSFINESDPEAYFSASKVDFTAVRAMDLEWE